MFVESGAILLMSIDGDDAVAESLGSRFDVARVQPAPKRKPKRRAQRGGV